MRPGGWYWAFGGQALLSSIKGRVWGQAPSASSSAWDAREFIIVTCSRPACSGYTSVMLLIRCQYDGDRRRGFNIQVQRNGQYRIGSRSRCAYQYCTLHDGAPLMPPRAQSACVGRTGHHFPPTISHPFRSFLDGQPRFQCAKDRAQDISSTAITLDVNPRYMFEFAEYLTCRHTCVQYTTCASTPGE